MWEAKHEGPVVTILAQMRGTPDLSSVHSILFLGSCTHPGLFTASRVGFLCGRQLAHGSWTFHVIAEKYGVPYRAHE